MHTSCVCVCVCVCIHVLKKWGKKRKDVGSWGDLGITKRIEKILRAKSNVSNIGFYMLVGIRDNERDNVVRGCRPSYDDIRASIVISEVSFLSAYPFEHSYTYRCIRVWSRIWHVTSISHAVRVPRRGARGNRPGHASSYRVRNR